MPVMEELSELNFDQVSRKKLGGYDLMSPQEWLDMPLTERVELLSNGDIEFLKGDETIPVLAALKCIKEKGLNKA